MEFVETILKQIWGFFSLDGLIEMIRSGDYKTLQTFEGITRSIAPLMPIILILELIRGLLYKQFKVVSYKISFFSYVFNSIIGRYLAIGMTIICIGIFEKYSVSMESFSNLKIKSLTITMSKSTDILSPVTNPKDNSESIL